MQTQMVEFAANGDKAPGYLARPEGNAPGIVVIQEWWGLNAHIKEGLGGARGGQVGPGLGGGDLGP